MTKEFKKRMLFLLELDFLNGQIEKLELEKEELRKQFSLNSVSQQRELLELVTEIANSKQDYSNTRHKLWAKKLIGSNCG
jgi:hypothetical protein